MGEEEPFSIRPGGGVVLDVHVQPGASRSKVVGRHGEAVKVRVAAPPERGRANAALEALLAEELGTSRRDVAVVSGETARNKRVRIDNVDVDAVRRWCGGLAG
jgi:uncharacterized protein